MSGSAEDRSSEPQIHEKSLGDLEGLVPELAVAAVSGIAGIPPAAIGAFVEHVPPNPAPKPEEALRYTWEDYKLRQTHYWASVNRFAVAVITLLVVPHLQLAGVAALKDTLWFLPTIGMGLSVAATWLLGAEYQRLRSVKLKYEWLMTPLYTPIHPTKTRWQRICGGNIGMVTTLLFGVGFVGLSIVDFFLLEGWEKLADLF
jgi:hypothetical protein